MRTEEGELDFAKACMVIEKRGGDVLAYIAKEYPSYTPRPVWYRLQRDYLKRKPFQITEGRPKIPERKKVDEVRKETRNSQEDTVRALIDAHKAGKSIRECLQELGYTNVASALRNAKGWARKNRPEMAKELERIGLGRPPVKPEEPGKKPVDDQTGEHQAEAEKAPEKVTLGGKTYETFVRVENPDGTVIDRKITEHMPEGDVTKDPEQAVYPIGGKPMTFSITGVRSALGKWQIDADGDYVFIADNESGSCIMSLSMKEWLNLSAEIPAVIRVMNGMK